MTVLNIYAKAFGLSQKRCTGISALARNLVRLGLFYFVSYQVYSRNPNTQEQIIAVVQSNQNDDFNLHYREYSWVGHRCVG